MNQRSHKKNRIVIWRPHDESQTLYIGKYDFVANVSDAELLSKKEAETLYGMIPRYKILTPEETVILLAMKS